MHDEVQPSHGSEPVVLSREPDIDLGLVLIRPSAREVHTAENVLTLEPRVMQVLVALARSPGTVVSRDDLIDLCWEGRIVGDDAITRCVGALRKLAINCNEAFEIETLPKIGYRLAISQERRKEQHRHALFEGLAAVHSGAVKSGTLSPPSPIVTPQSAFRPLAIRAAAVIGAVCATLIAAWLFDANAFTPSSDTSGWTVANVRTFASSPAAEREPMISPDGRMIAFSRGASHHRSIYVQGLNSSEPLQVTNDDQTVGRGIDKSAPVWSPDGSQIAYLLRPDDTPCRIVVQPFPKGTPREVGRCVGATRGRLAWSPQGDALIHIDQLTPGAPHCLMKLDLRTGKSTPLTKPPVGDGDSGNVISPDGNSLLFVRAEDGKPIQLSMLNLRTSTARVLRTGEGFLTGAWSEDSSTIFFAERGPHDDLRLKAMRLSDGRTDDLYTFSDSNMRAPMSGRRNVLALAFERGHFQLGYAPKAGDGSPDTMHTSEDHVFMPAFSSRGELAYGVFRGGQVAVQTREPGKERQELAVWTGALDDLSWSADGNVLAIGLVLDSGTQVRLVDRRDLSTRTIELGGHDIGQMSWTPQQHLLVPVLKDHWHLMSVDTTAGTSAPAGFPDGNWDSVQVRGNEIFAARQGMSGLWRLDGTERQVSSAPPFQVRMSAFERHWKVIGNDVVYPRLDTQSLVAQPLEGGSHRLLAHLPGLSDSLEFDIDPKTRRVMYQLGASDTDIMLLYLQPR